ncbi:HAD-IA family hydrolase [Planktomarina sp.]|jgi:HAD superfamily hydrolase (TIGR01509 family)|nr:HAD-IA family hydrolase [Planktomarina sp.]
MSQLECVPKLVIFDCDGVVVDSEPLTLQLIRDDLAARGLPLDLSKVTDLFVGGTIAGAGAQARAMGADISADWADLIYDKVFAALARSVEPIPGIGAVLDRLDHQGIPYAIGSNGPHRKMEITLARCGMSARFAGRTYSREDVAAPKPAPDVYLLAASQAGVAPQDCVVIEDSATGAQAAVAAGMAVFGFARETPRTKFEGLTELLFDDMAQLLALLGLPTE